MDALEKGCLFATGRPSSAPTTTPDRHYQVDERQSSHETDAHQAMDLGMDQEQRQLNISESDLCSLTANLGGILLNKVERHDEDAERIPLVHTPTLTKNLQLLGVAISLRLPILLLGDFGCGKSSLLQEAARLVNQKGGSILAPSKPGT